MRLPWHNIAHDRMRFLVTVLGISCATLLIIIQGSILVGFLAASSKVIDATDSDIWIAGRGASCFEFPVVFERRVEELARGVTGVAATSRIVTRIVPFRVSEGSQQLVTLIGADPTAGKHFPTPALPGTQDVIEPRAVLIDESSKALLVGDHQIPHAIELNEQRATVASETSGFSSFLGTPYVFTSFVSGARYAGLRSSEVMFILVRVEPGVAIEAVQRELRERLPNVDVWTKAQFARKAQTYWMSQTGAGGAILAGALLGFVIGVAIVSQSTYATTMEHIEEFATLKALGANHLFVVRVVVTQALVCGVLGYCLGTGFSKPVSQMAKAVIPWLATPSWLPFAIFPLALLMCAVASMISVRAALAVEPGRVFRA